MKCLQLNLDILHVFHTDNNRQHPYFEDPYVVETDGEIVGEGKLLGYNKSENCYELQREFDFYCHAYQTIPVTTVLSKIADQISL